MRQRYVLNYIHIVMENLEGSNIFGSKRSIFLFDIEEIFYFTVEGGMPVGGNADRGDERNDGVSHNHQDWPVDQVGKQKLSSKGKNVDIGEWLMNLIKLNTEAVSKL